MRSHARFRPWAGLCALGISTMILSGSVFDSALAHCGTMDGPAVTDARPALDSGDLAPPLKWIQPHAGRMPVSRPAAIT